MKIGNLHCRFRWVLFVLSVFCITAKAGECPVTTVANFQRALQVAQWQIARDEEPRSAFLHVPDSSWRIFTPDEQYTVGSWLLRACIRVQDTLAENDIIGLFPLNLIMAYEIYWDGKKVAANGTMGNSKESVRAGTYNYHVLMPAHLVTPGEHTLLIRLSNYSKAPVWKWFYGDIVLGKYDMFLDTMYRANYQTIFTTGILFIPFLFNMFLFIARKQKTEHLLFSIICFIVMIDSAAGLYPVFFNASNTFVYGQYYMYHVITILFTILFPAFFIYSFSLHKGLLGGVVVIPFIIYSLVTNPLQIFNVMTVTVLIMSSIVIAWAAYQKKENSLIILAGIVVAWAAYYFNFAFNGLATTMVICTSVSIARQFARKEKQEKEAQLKSARLENALLKKNINPHFILNTLTSIIVWLRKDALAAIKLIEVLAEEFRMINQISALQQIPIAQEIALCKAHLKIMSYRKGAEYTLETIDIDEQESIPPMILHTLVENGLTHGYENQMTGLFTLQRVHAPGLVTYILTNDGEFTPGDTKGSIGFGEKYIKGRLEESYPGRWEFSSFRTEQGWKSVIQVKVM